MTAAAPAARNQPPEWLGLLLAALVALLTSLHAPLGASLADAFQEGEYLSAILQFAPGVPRPLLIHGTMDYLPARAMLALAGPDHLVAGVRFANALLGVAASLLFLACLRAIPATRAGRLGATVAGCAFLLLVNGRIAGVVELQQGAPAIRDLGLLAELALLLRVERATGRAAGVLAGLAGLVAGLALFWAYNRGIVGVLALGAWMVGAQARGWRGMAIAMPLQGFCIGTAISIVADPPMAAQHLANILYWQGNQAIWAKWPDFLPEILAAAAFAAATLALLAGYAAALVLGWRKDLNEKAIASLLMLGAVVVPMAYGTLNRLDSHHLRFTLPFQLILLIYIVFQWFPATLPRPTRPQRWLAAGLGIWLLAMANPLPMARNLAENLALLTRGLPADRTLAPPQLTAAAAALRAGKGACTYAFDNGGAVYHLAGLPPCAAAMIPVYAAGPQEKHLIAELSARRPPLVIAGSDAWYAAIDGKPLAQRTPELHRWLTAHYAPDRQIGGIALWRLR